MSSVGLFPSAIRFGLDDLQPFEETIEQRIGNIKFVIKQLSLRPSESFHDYSTLSAHAIIENINDLPMEFQKEKLRDFLAHHFERVVESDADLKKLVMQVEQGQILPREKFVFSTLLSRFASRYTDHVDDYVRGEMLQFLNSDLPFTMFDEFGLFNRTFGAFLPTVAEATKRMYSRVSGSHKSRGIQGSKMPLAKFKKGVANLLSASDFAWISHVSLKLYLELKHSKNIDELFKPKQYTAQRLHRGEYERLLEDFTRNNFMFREELNKYGLRGLSHMDRKVSTPVYTVWREMNSLRLLQA